MVLEDNLWPPHFLKEMYDLFQNGELVDVHLKTTDGKRISAHRSVLAASSPYFRGMFSGSFAESSLEEILLNEITGDALHQIVGYCYTGKINVNVTNLEDIVMAVNLFQMIRLQEICSEELVKSLHTDNCMAIHNFADAHNLQTVLKKSHPFILEHFSNIWEQSEFTKLTKQQLFSLLESDYLVVRSEEEVFNALMRWVHTSPIDREMLLSELLQLIRLEELSSEFLLKHINEVELKLKSDCARLLLDANTRNQLPNLPSEISLRPSGRPRRRHINDCLVAFASSGKNEATLEWYSPEKNEWTIWRSGTQLNSFCAVYLDFKIIIIEHSNTVEAGRVWSLDLNNLSFTQLESLNTPRSGFCAVELNGCVYVMGGNCYQRNVALNTVEKYDPISNTWTYITPMNYARSKAAATTFNGKLYVFSGCGRPTWAQGEYYDHSKNEWTVTSSRRHREEACAVSLNGFIYIMGGVVIENRKRHRYERMHRYDPRTDTWTTENIASMSFLRNSAGAAAMSNKIFFAGGFNKHNTALCKRMVDQYDSEKNIWTQIAPMNEGSTNLSLFTVQNLKMPAIATQCKS